LNGKLVITVSYSEKGPVMWLGTFVKRVKVLMHYREPRIIIFKDHRPRLLD